MRRILKRREVVPAGDSPAGRSVMADEWRLFGEDASDTDPIIIPIAELRRDTDAWLVRARSARLGVRLDLERLTRESSAGAAAESLESLADVLPHLALVAVEFPNVGDGRGFSYGRLLRDRLGFKGELRAVGAGVKQDRIFLLARAGFDSFELPPGENAAEALAAFERYDVVYQPGTPVDGIRRQRLFAA